MKNSLNHIWSIICSNSLLDKDTNNLSLFNTIERFAVKVPESELDKQKKDGKDGIAFPVVFQVVSRLYRTEAKKAETFDYRVSLINPEGKVVAHSSQKLAMDKNIKNFRVRTNFNSLPVTGPGEYAMIIEFKDIIDSKFEKVAHLPLDIVVETTN